MTKTKIYIAFFVLLILIVITALFDMMLGSVHLDFQNVWNMLKGEAGEARTHTYILEMRLHRIYVAIFSGAGLSISGLVLQSLFRNPLAGPSVLGISSGASFGVGLLLLFFPTWMMQSGNSQIAMTFLFAIVGAFGVMFIIIMAGARLKSNIAMLIAGIMISYVLGAGVQIMLQYAKAEETRNFVLWGLGSFSDAPLLQIQILMIVVIVMSILLFTLSKPINGMLLGEKYAQSMGISVKKIRLFIIIATSIITGVVTAVCGPIAFVGIAVPHIVKMFFKTSDHKILIPFTLLVGVWVCLVSDLLSSYPIVLPLNAVTSLLGAPVIIWIIFKRHKHVGL